MTAAQRAAALIAPFPRQGQVRDNAVWQTLQQAIQAAVQSRDQDLLFALHDACTDHPLLQGWPRQSAWRAAGLIDDAGALRRFLERAKTPPTSEQRWGTKTELPDTPARNLGAMLAHAHDDSLLERELEHFGLDPELRELFACWIHERIARGSPIGRSAFVQHFQRALPSEHPLRSLPLELTSLDAGLVVRGERKTDTLGNWFEFGPLEWGGFKAEGEWQGKVEEELTIDASELAAVASSPALCPNTTFEARCFRLAARPPSLRELWLQPLGLECLIGAPVTVRACSARHVMQLLIMLATSGGAYAESRSAAHGRAMAWRSMTAFVGLPPGAPFTEVEALAERSEWLSFECKSGWFHQVALDVGLVSLRPDKSLSVLAVTDTD